MNWPKVAFYLCLITTSMTAVVFFALPNPLTTISFASCLISLLTVNRGQG